MSELDSRKVDYIVMILGEFARHEGVPVKDGFFKLLGCGGIDALDEFYDVEHTLPVSTTVADLAALCARGSA